MTKKNRITSNIEIVNVTDLSAMIDKWHKAVKKSTPPKAEECVEVFENLGFIDIVPNEDGTVNATRDNKRFIGLEFPKPVNCYNDKEDRGVVEVSFSFDKQARTIVEGET